jgi:hypothetical protein
VNRIRILLLCLLTLSAVFVVGCGAAEDPKGGQEAHQHRHSPTAKKLQLRPTHSSGVSGTASFEDGSDGLVVKLRLHDLPESDTLYLAHIHPGSCAGSEAEEEHHEEGQEAQERGEHAQEQQGEGHDEPGKQIEYPLSQVESDSEGDGSSTTKLEDTSVEKLFSGVPRHLNVHEAGSGTPPILACANLREEEQLGAENQQGSHGQSHGQQAGHEQHPTYKACREEPEHLRVFNCEPMAMEGVEYEVKMQPQRDRHTYEQTLANIDRVVPNELAIEVYFYSGQRDYRERYQNAVATLSVAGEYTVGQYGGTAPPMEGKLQRK